MSTLAFTVRGHAIGAGSKELVPKRGGAPGEKVIVDSSGNAGKKWRKDVQRAATAAIERHRPGITPPLIMLRETPLFLSLTFYVARPKDHYSRSAAGGLLPSAPEFPVKRPDATKLTRAVEDALTGIVWPDDAQVVGQRVAKLYGSPERVEVAVTVLR